ncbi:ABC transporter ATP-binding protein [Methylobacterium organophilum]|uniref:Spermidine/putrescine import ATP-binding protein PotA n=1 Tax=Methylobacterium organophilum TaxID=410 RepID=A0ABQ4TAS2_METOR|nr:ABC transporter ATP-binding protein [Methylobacterium organophilum]UMY16724.1 ABC transporter ATP-binding protein [Methylobacterium organophilum]GJE27677.1 Spermidine/putrescine import ATP-binding protein PotA [Methylobacterium organophilum]
MSASSGHPFLAIRGIRRSYGAVVAVEAVSLDIARGEFVTFLGPSGSGKSTTLYVIAGFQEPNAGDVLIEGRSILNTPSNKRNIGMVFQRYTLFPQMTIAENVGFPLKVRRWSRADIDARVKAMLKLVHLEAYADRKPAQLSGGQQQRVALARALAYEPPLLLMDEPLSALDKSLREELQHEIKRVHHETGVTILYVTHDQEEALRLSDRIALFRQGRIEQLGTGRDLYDAPSSRFVAGFIGHSNFMPCRIDRRLGGAGDGAILLADGTSLEGLSLAAMPAQCEAGVLMVRPDAIRLHAPDNAPAGAIFGTVDEASFCGEAMQYSVATAWGDSVTVRIPCDAGRARVGERVALAWRPEQAQIFPN